MRLEFDGCIFVEGIQTFHLIATRAHRNPFVVVYLRHSWKKYLVVAYCIDWWGSSPKQKNWVPVVIIMASKMQNCEEAGALELVCGTVNCHVSMLPLEFYVSFVESEQDVSCSFFSTQPWALKPACFFFFSYKTLTTTVFQCQMKLWTFEDFIFRRHVWEELIIANGMNILCKS